jgi:hypothetical protein
MKHEEEIDSARLEASRTDLARRAALPSISTETMDEMIKSWRVERNRRRQVGFASRDLI